MKKAKPHPAPAHHTPATGTAVLAAPVRRRRPKGCKPPQSGRGEFDAPAETALELGTPVNVRGVLGTARPDGNSQHPLEDATEGRLPGLISPEEVELQLLIEGLYLQSGFDFRNYRRPLVRERVAAFLERERFKSISALQAAVLREPPVLERLVIHLTERRTPLFGEPGFYRAFRQEIVPWLRTYPFARIWVAGCGNGGEAYSLAAVLLEEGLHERCRIYATDLCEGVVQQAQAALWPLAELKRTAANYRRAGGQESFLQYYTVESGRGRLAPALSRNIVFAAHSLLTDASFNEFHLIVCRAVMDDFDPILQSQVHDLLYSSLVPRGVLALGHPHQLNLSLHQSYYEPLLAEQGLYRKKWPHATF